MRPFWSFGPLGHFGQNCHYFAHFGQPFRARVDTPKKEPRLGVCLDQRANETELRLYSCEIRPTGSQANFLLTGVLFFSQIEGRRPLCRLVCFLKSEPGEGWFSHQHAWRSLLLAAEVGTPARSCLSSLGRRPARSLRANPDDRAAPLLVLCSPFLPARCRTSSNSR